MELHIYCTIWRLLEYEWTDLWTQFIFDLDLFRFFITWLVWGATCVKFTWRESTIALDDYDVTLYYERDFAWSVIGLWLIRRLIDQDDDWSLIIDHRSVGILIGCSFIDLIAVSLSMLWSVWVLLCLLCKLYHPTLCNCYALWFLFNASISLSRSLCPFTLILFALSTKNVHLPIYINFRAISLPVTWHFIVSKLPT